MRAVSKTGRMPMPFRQGDGSRVYFRHVEKNGLSRCVS